jgi:hypothetical protein
MRMSLGHVHTQWTCRPERRRTGTEPQFPQMLQRHRESLLRARLASRW